MKYWYGISIVVSDPDNIGIRVVPENELISESTPTEAHEILSGIGFDELAETYFESSDVSSVDEVHKLLAGAGFVHKAEMDEEKTW